jgi:probable HAF family extracellular repeat protein
MNSRFRIRVSVALVLALTTTLVLSAQNRQTVARHHHYNLIDMGTFGGPQSYFNSLNLTDAFNFPTVFYNIAQVHNGKGTFVGFADTSTPDPNPAFCYVPDCYVTHAFDSRDGIKTDLGALPGGGSSAAFWINSAGWITGNSENGQTDPANFDLPELRAVLWKDGHIRDLGTLGGSTSVSQAINDRGQITGLALNEVPDPFSYYYQFAYCLAFQICPPNPTETRGFVWNEKDGMQDIGTLGGPDALPSVINQRGQVAGYSYIDSTPNATTGLPTYHPFLWEKGKGMEDLGSFGGTQTASVNGLNDRGEVVGGLLLPGDQINHPFLWDGKKLIDLTAPPFGGDIADGEAMWVNDAGDVVGNAPLPVLCPDSSGPWNQAFLWTQGAIRDLGALAGEPISRADFINSTSQVVGVSFPCDFSAATAFLWENESMVDLNTLISPDSQLYLFWASYIDDQGEIAALAALPNGDTHAAWLVPCDDNHTGIEGCDYSFVSAGGFNRVQPPSASSGASSNPILRKAFSQRKLHSGHVLR